MARGVLLQVVGSGILIEASTRGLNLCLDGIFTVSGTCTSPFYIPWDKVVDNILVIFLGVAFRYPRLLLLVYKSHHFAITA
jgi:hypothetical protein